MYFSLNNLFIKAKQAESEEKHQNPTAGSMPSTSSLKKENAPLVISQLPEPLKQLPMVEPTHAAEGFPTLFSTTKKTENQFYYRFITD